MSGYCNEVVSVMVKLWKGSSGDVYLLTLECNFSVSVNIHSKLMATLLAFVRLLLCES